MMTKLNNPHTNVSPKPQPVGEGPGCCAFFISLQIADDAKALATVREFCATFPALLRSMNIRDTHHSVKGVLGFGATAWDRLFGTPKPAQLRVFEEVKGSRHVAPSTPADLFFHLRANTTDVCFELARLIMDTLGDAVTPHDEVQGFRFFDSRTIIGFVDGTENPIDDEAYEITVIGDEDPDFAGGSYVFIQRYEHDMKAWNALPTEEQEKTIGRRKFDDVELSDEEKPSNAHNALTHVTDDNGNDLQILRDSLPYGNPSQGVYGTFFIAYTKDPSIIEKIVTNMFIGNPPGNSDRLLNYSTAKTGAFFFVPSFSLLDELAGRLPETSTVASTPTSDVKADESVIRNADGSLVIGSLKQTPQNF